MKSNSTVKHYESISEYCESIIEEVDSASESEEEEHTKEDSEEDKEASEKRTYENVYEYLTKGCYPQGATKAEKGVLRRRAKSFRLVDGILHYEGKERNLKQVN